jgi:hypothetical protein
VRPACSAHYPDPESDLLDFPGKTNNNPDLVKAAKEVLEHIGAER